MIHNTGAVTISSSIDPAKREFFSKADTVGFAVFEFDTCLPSDYKRTCSFLYQAVHPPSIVNAAPVISAEAGDDKNTTAPMMSSSSPSLPMGMR